MLEQTFVIIKPDAVRRSLIGEIIKRFEDAGLKVIKLNMFEASEELISKHYPEDPEYLEIIGKKSEAAGDKVTNYIEQGRMIVKAMRDFMTSGALVDMILEGDDAVAQARKIIGYTDPVTADKGTIRGDLGEDSIQKANAQKRPVYNLVHASGTPDEAKKEIQLWFGE